MRRRTRSRRRSSRPWTLGVLLVLVVLGISMVAISPTQSYRTATVDRQVAGDVVVDENAILSLDLATNVTTGETEELVNVTNYVGQQISVTVTLTAGSGSYGDLVIDGSNVGDSASFSLSKRASQRIEFSAPCNDSLESKSVTFDIDISGTGISGTATRAVDIELGCTDGVVYAVPTSRDLRTIRNDTGITRYDATGVDVIAPQQRNLDDDSPVEIAFVNSSSGDIYTIDRNNETSVLLDPGTLSGVLGDGAEPTKSKMAVGTWNGSEPSVFFVDNSESYIYRVDDDESQEIVKPSNDASAVVGVTDIDTDGAAEIVFVDGSSQLRYVQEDGSTIEKISNGGVGTNNGVGAGAPADFDGDGTPRVPFVDGSSVLSLVTSDGNKTLLKNEGNKIYVDKAPVASFDWDDDGRPEIIALDGGVLYVIDNIGGDITVTKITADGTGVDAAKEPGAA